MADSAAETTMPVSITQTSIRRDIDALGLKLRALNLKIDQLEAKNAFVERELSILETEVRDTLREHISKDNAWRSRISDRLDDQIALLNKLAVEVINNNVQDVSRWKDTMRYWSIVALGMAIIAVTLKEDVAAMLTHVWAVIGK
jgi:predicted RNase H-like nuclease (RuvC/YqgF family)